MSQSDSLRSYSGFDADIHDVGQSFTHPFVFAPEDRQSRFLPLTKSIQDEPSARVLPNVQGESERRVLAKKQPVVVEVLRRNRFSPSDHPQKIDVLTALRERKLSHRAIAEKYGVNRKTVAVWERELGLAPVQKKMSHEERSQKSAAIDADIILHKDSINFEQMALKWGASPTMVSDHAKKIARQTGHIIKHATHRGVPLPPELQEKVDLSITRCIEAHQTPQYDALAEELGISVDPFRKAYRRLSYNILLVDQDVSTRSQIARHLKDKMGWRVRQAGTLVEGMTLLSKEEFKAVVFEFSKNASAVTDLTTEVRSIRNLYNGPLVVTSPQIDPETSRAYAVASFEAGVDGFIERPANIKEVPFYIALLAAKLKACKRQKALLRKPGENPIHKITNRVSIETKGQRVFVDGKSINLTSSQYRFVAALFLNKGEPISKSALREKIFSGMNGVEPEVENNDLLENSIEIIAVRTRDVFDKAAGEKKFGAKIIITEPGAGYRIVTSSQSAELSQIQTKPVARPKAVARAAETKARSHRNMSLLFAKRPMDSLSVR